jgi:hypothetical protein
MNFSKPDYPCIRIRQSSVSIQETAIYHFIFRSILKRRSLSFHFSLWVYLQSVNCSIQAIHSDCMSRSCIQIQAPRKCGLSCRVKEAEISIAALGDVRYRWQCVVSTGLTYLTGLSDKVADRVEVCLCVEDCNLDARPRVINAEKT